MDNMKKELLNSGKELLLRDLCARLPYGVKLNMKGLIGVSHHTTILYGKNTEMYFRYGCNDYFINEIKPYLFPLSSMTEEQKFECLKGTTLEIDKHGDIVVKDDCYGGSKYTDLEMYLDVIDWLNENHFDYRGLIGKSLALDATNLRIYE